MKIKEQKKYSRSDRLQDNIDFVSTSLVENPCPKSKPFHHNDDNNHD